MEYELSSSELNQLAELPNQDIVYLCQLGQTFSAPRHVFFHLRQKNVLRIGNTEPFTAAAYMNVCDALDEATAADYLLAATCLQQSPFVSHRSLSPQLDGLFGTNHVLACKQVTLMQALQLETA